MEVLDLVEGPLSGEKWISDTSMSKEFFDFLKVQALSDEASRDTEFWTIYLKPLTGTKKEDVMKQLWYNINKASDKGISTPTLTRGSAVLSEG